jgi:hypothetical protein
MTAKLGNAAYENTHRAKCLFIALILLCAVQVTHSLRPQKLSKVKPSLDRAWPDPSRLRRTPQAIATMESAYPGMLTSARRKRANWRVALPATGLVVIVIEVETASVKMKRY